MEEKVCLKRGRVASEEAICRLIVHPIRIILRVLAGVVKLADTRDLGSRAARCAGSSPVSSKF